MYNYSVDPKSAAYYDAYRRAEKRVKAKIGFYWHLASYVIVNGLFIAIYLLTSAAAGDLYYPWFIWPMMMWGIGLAFNAASVFLFNEGAVKDRMLDQELRRMGAVPPASNGSYAAPVDYRIEDKK
ncbi:MAG TPA: 2TM domain-containing protein [Chloroflexia bacterium]|nr:2TM domain-containing protein [Chloroflexia bacterium]